MVDRGELLELLESEEPDYERAAGFGPEVLAELEALVREAPPLLASKATHFASHIPSPGAQSVLELAARREEAEVRVAAASALGNLPPSRWSMADGDSAPGLLTKLMGDPDPGVRKFAKRSAATIEADLVDHDAARPPERRIK